MPTASRKLLILVVGEEQMLSSRAEAILRNRGWQARAAWAADIHEAEEVLSRAEPELVVADRSVDTASICDLARQLSPELPVIVVGREEKDFAPAARSAAMQAGAADVVGVGSEQAEAHFAEVCRRELDSSRRSWALREARMRLAEYESRQRALVAETSRAILTISEGIIVEANPATAELLGFEDVDALLAQPFLDLVHGEHQAHAREHLAQLTKGRVTDTEFDAELKSGTGVVAVTCRISARYTEDDSELQLDIVLRPQAGRAQQPTGATPRAQTFAEIREALQTALTAALESDAHHGLLYFRLDGFHEHEKRMGLTPAARLADTWDAFVAESLPSQAQAFRMAPEEIAAVCPAQSTESLEELAESLRLGVAQQNFRTGEFDCHLSCSIAVYPLGEGAPAPETLLGESCFEARRISTERGNSVCSIGDTARAAAEERKAREAAEDIRAALDEGNRFRLAYQNIACLCDDTRQIFDVLVRMRDAGGNELHAREFLPIAERFGLMPDIDRWVLGRAMQVVSRRRGTCLFLRLAEASLRAPEALIKQIEEQRPEPGSLGIQLREAVLQRHVSKAAAVREKLRALRIELVIDHFGDDPASGSLLEHLRPDYVKFSPEFAARLEEAAVHERLENLVKAAHRLGVRVIVPFVENTRVMGALWQMGINYVQGNGVQEAEAVMLSGERIPH